MHILNLFLWNKCHLLTMLSLTLSKKAYMQAYPEFFPLKQIPSAEPFVTYFIEKGIYACISWFYSFETNVICSLHCHLLYQKSICACISWICSFETNAICWPHCHSLYQKGIDACISWICYFWNKCHRLTTLSLTLSKKAYMHAYPEFVPLKQMPSDDSIVTYFIVKGIYACISWNLLVWNKCHMLTTLSVTLSKKAYMHAYPEFIPLKQMSSAD